MDVQQADFRCCLSEEMKIHLKCAIDVSHSDNFTVEEIHDKIQENLRQKRNFALDRVAFEERKQLEGESFDHFCVSLNPLWKIQQHWATKSQ